MKIYCQYLRYVLAHKWHVLIEAWKMGLIWHGIVHDLSKFRPSEFFAYAEKFYGKKCYNVVLDFRYAWLKHQHRNPHHWQYWCQVNDATKCTPMEMPDKYLKQMIADWRGMARARGNAPGDYYKKMGHRMQMTATTHKRITEHLGVTFDRPSETL